MSRLDQLRFPQGHGGPSIALPPVWRFQEQQREEGDRLPKELMPQNSNGTVAGCDPVCQLLPGGSVKGCFGQMSVQGRPERPIPG